MSYSARRQFAAETIALFFSILSAASSSHTWRVAQLSSHPINLFASGSALWVCGTGEMIAESNDAGQSWQIKHQNAGGSALLSIGFANDRIGYSTGTGGVLLLTADGGSTWNQVKVGTEPIHSAAFADAGHGLIHTASAVEFTSNGGTSWDIPSVLKSDAQLNKFKFVLSLAALDADHMAVLLKEGPAQYYDQRIVATQDGGKTWKTVNVPDVGLIALVTRNGEFWAFGHEVIEKEKKGGGYGVALVMHSRDAEKWEHNPRPAKEFANCTRDGCLFGDGAGVDPFGSKPSYWTFPAEKVITAKWAIVRDTLCTVSGELRCTTISPFPTLPEQLNRGSIPPAMTPPALGAPRPAGLICISCPYERVVVSDKASGLSEIHLGLLIKTDGTVSDVNVVKAPTPELGTRFAEAARSWIFEPYMKDGLAVQAHTVVKLRVQIIKSS